MSFKRFREQDLVYTTLKTHPEYNFVVNEKKIYLQKERTAKGNLSHEAIKHVPTGSVSLYELNIDRAEDLVSLTVPLSQADGTPTRPYSMTEAERNALPPGATEASVSYPMSASLSRIYVPADPDGFASVYSSRPNASNGKHKRTVTPSENRKYVMALQNLISQPDDLQQGDFSEYELSAVNMICIPGVFSGSGLKKGSIKLDYYRDATLKARAQDKFSDGRMICTVANGESIEGTQVGIVLYNHGLILLTNSNDLSTEYTENYFAKDKPVRPSWLNFGTGIHEPNNPIDLSGYATKKDSYVVNFKGINKIPTLTMFAFSERGEHNFSNNPTFVVNELPDNTGGDGATLLDNYSLSATSFTEPEAKVKKINKSAYADAEADFVSTTYISKVGIYDEDKNLIAVATLANPAKKTDKRDFMIKMKIDF